MLRFITAGSVDDGKSTLIGRMLHDSRQVLEDQLVAVEQASRRRGMAAVDLSLLTDGLEAEREQGITIDVAYRYFATARRKFVVADTPGHEQYTRNMVTGASTAHAAVVLADATRGLVEQGRRHLYIAHLIGIRDIVVAVNKMDLVGYERHAFERVREAFEDYAESFEAPRPRLHFVPASALNGDMVVERGERLAWYTGPTLLDLLETIEPAADAATLPLRFPVQLVQRTPERGRVYLGRVGSGTVSVGDRIIVLSSGVSTAVAALYGSNGRCDTAVAGDSIGIAVADEIDVSRGDVLADAAHSKPVRSFDATLVWLAAVPLETGRVYLLKHGTRPVKAKVALVSGVTDVKTLERRAPAGSIGMNSIVHAALTVQQPLPVDAYGRNRATGAFVLIDEASHQTVAAGMVREAGIDEPLRTEAQ